MGLTFLSKLGQIINQTAGLVPAFTPLATTLAGHPVPIMQTTSDQLTQIAGVIAGVEVIGQAIKAPGTQKLTLSIPLVTQIVMASPLLHNKTVKNKQLFLEGVTDMSSGMAKILNSIDEASVEVQQVVQP